MLEARALSKKYDEKYALNNLDLKVSAGEVYCLLGANGAGKTTTINLFLNFISPTSGEALINGVNVADEPVATKRALAYIPENLVLYPNLTGAENLQFFAGLGGEKPGKPAVIQLLTEAGLQKEAFDLRVAKYSKGMRQKVGIAIARAKNAEHLLLDEPTSGLDPQASNEFAQLLATLREKGVAILMATHDLFRARESGTHIGIMRAGELVHSLKSEDISLNELEKLYLDTMKSTVYA